MWLSKCSVFFCFFCFSIYTPQLLPNTRARRGLINKKCSVVTLDTSYYHSSPVDSHDRLSSFGAPDAPPARVTLSPARAALACWLTCTRTTPAFSSTRPDRQQRLSPLCFKFPPASSKPRPLHTPSARGRRGDREGRGKFP